MAYQWQQTMKDAISEVLETMFFLPVDFDSAEETGQVYWCRSTIEMKHMEHPESSCNISIYLVEPCAKAIAANFLGKMEEEVSLGEIEDTLKEVANMLGGSFLFKSNLDEYQLCIPQFMWLKEDHGLADGMERVLFYSMGEPGGAITYSQTIDSSH